MCGDASLSNRTALVDRQYAIWVCGNSTRTELRIHPLLGSGSRAMYYPGAPATVDRRCRLRLTSNPAHRHRELIRRLAHDSQGWSGSVPVGCPSIAHPDPRQQQSRGLKVPKLPCRHGRDSGSSPDPVAMSLRQHVAIADVFASSRIVGRYPHVRGQSLPSHGTKQPRLSSARPPVNQASSVRQRRTEFLQKQTPPVPSACNASCPSHAPAWSEPKLSR